MCMHKLWSRVLFETDSKIKSWLTTWPYMCSTFQFFNIPKIDLLLIGRLQTNFSEILIKAQGFSFKKMLLKSSISSDL